MFSIWFNNFKKNGAVVCYNCGDSTMTPAKRDYEQYKHYKPHRHGN